MSDFGIRSDSVDVEQIMSRIRARIREKRGVDYTEEEVRELASVKLEKFLDPKSVRSDLVEHYRRRRPSPPLDLPFAESYAFEDDTIYMSSRSLSGQIIAGIRKLLNPVLKLFFNPNPIIHVLHLQAQHNEHEKELFDRVAGWVTTQDKLRNELDVLNYEVLNNLVVEITRLGIEVKNLKMHFESLSSRLDFDERRARALEGVVQYRPVAAPAPASRLAEVAPVAGAGGDETSQAEGGPGSRSRRRRRRGRRRGGMASEGGAPGDPTRTADGVGDEDERPAHDEDPESIRPAPHGDPLLASARGTDSAHGTDSTGGTDSARDSEPGGGPHAGARRGTGLDSGPAALEPHTGQGRESRLDNTPAADAQARNRPDSDQS